MFAGIFSCTPSFSPEINKVYLILSYLILSYLLTHVAQRFFWEPATFQNLLGWWHQKLVSCTGLICNTYTYIWVIPRQITQGPTWPVSDVSEKLLKKYLNVF